MAGLATVAGGAKLAGLTSSEHLAAQQALLKLGAKFGAASAEQRVALKPLQGGSGLLAGQGNDTFAGGGRGLSPGGLGSDTVVGGSTGDLSAHAAGASLLGAETINIAGVTAAGVKALDPSTVHAGSHTVTLADKTTLNITGASPHQIVKH